MDFYKNGSMDWFFDEWVYGTEMPSYDFTYQLSSGPNGKTLLSGKITQSGVSDKFVMPVPVYVDFGKGWAYLGAATLVGNSSVDITNVPLPEKPKKVAIAALQDILAEKNESNKTVIRKTFFIVEALPYKKMVKLLFCPNLPINRLKNGK